MVWRLVAIYFLDTNMLEKKGGQSKHLKIENQANLWNNFKSLYSAMYTKQFCFGLVHFR